MASSTDRLERSATVPRTAIPIRYSAQREQVLAILARWSLSLADLATDLPDRSACAS